MRYQQGTVCGLWFVFSFGRSFGRSFVSLFCFCIFRLFACSFFVLSFRLFWFTLLLSQQFSFCFRKPLNAAKLCRVTSSTTLWSSCRKRIRCLQRSTLTNSSSIFPMWSLSKCLGCRKKPGTNSLRGSELSKRKKRDYFDFVFDLKNGSENVLFDFFGIGCVRVQKNFGRKCWINKHSRD